MNKSKLVHKKTSITLHLRSELINVHLMASSFVTLKKNFHLYSLNFYEGSILPNKHTSKKNVRVENNSFLQNSILKIRNFSPLG